MEGWRQVCRQGMLESGLPSWEAGVRSAVMRGWSQVCRHERLESGLRSWEAGDRYAVKGGWRQVYRNGTLESGLPLWEAGMPESEDVLLSVSSLAGRLSLPIFDVRVITSFSALQASRLLSDALPALLTLLYGATYR